METLGCNDMINNDIYQKYKELSNNEKNIFFKGRLGEYKYFDMVDTIKSALDFCEQF